MNEQLQKSVQTALGRLLTGATEDFAKFAAHIATAATEAAATNDTAMMEEVTEQLEFLATNQALRANGVAWALIQDVITGVAGAYVAGANPS